MAFNREVIDSTATDYNVDEISENDFENYCKGRDIKINLKNLRFHNFFSELGIFVLEK